MWTLHDEDAGGGPPRRPDFVASLRAASRVDIHGYASSDGPSATYDLNLSCMRANDAQSRLVTLGVAAAKVHTHKHGGTGTFPTAVENRWVVIADEREPEPEPTRRRLRVAAVGFLSCTP